jgi:hypothetical protein
MISSAHPKSTAVKSILDKGGSKGNSAILLPNFVKSPSSSKAESAYNYSSAATSVWTGGGSIKSKFKRSFIPIAFSSKTVFAKLVLCISGTVVLIISFLNAFSVYNL